MSLLYSFYGDDFTGSTDVLEQLGSNGVAAVLFLAVPTEEQLQRFSHVRAIGIAGEARSRSPEWMDDNLPRIFERLREFGAPVVHYKVCSTFDSSAERGSVGRAIEIGRSVFGAEPVPVVVGAPHLKRYVAFANLFAKDSDGSVRRIDRHSMSRHPTTPMHEADLRLHLAEQTGIKIGLVDLPAVESGELAEAVEEASSAGAGAIVFDSTCNRHQETLGEYFWGLRPREPRFYVGSSGLTQALTMAWTRAGELAGEEPALPVRDAGPLLVVSGSCSAVTERQLRYALAHGYRGVALNPAELLDPEGSTLKRVIADAVLSLASGQDTVLYTAMGTPVQGIDAEKLGAALGEITREILERASTSGAPIRRVLLCGGDTSSHAVQRLDAYALTWLANLQPGGPLCRLHADSELDGLEVVLKGGQVGTEDFFDVVRGM